MERRSLLFALPLVVAGCATPKPPPRDWFIFLETGKPTPPDRDEVMRMQRGHIENFKRLFDERKLFAAGPLRDPARVKRGIVVVRAASIDELRSYFEADDYVRLGHMTLNAVPARVNRGLATEGIDASGVEEVRIAMIARGPAHESGRTMVADLVAQGRFGAWYTLESGPIAEVLFTRSTDDAAIASLLAPHGGAVTVWAQWLGKGVVR